MNEKNNGKTDSAPEWQQEERRALATIFKYRERYEEARLDLESDCFLDGTNRRMAAEIEDEFTTSGRPPELQLLKQKFAAWEEMTAALAAVERSETFCPFHWLNDIIWFSHKRRVVRA